MTTRNDVLRGAAALLSGVIGAFALPFWSFWPLIFLSLGGFFYLSGKDRTFRQGFLTGWLFGLGYFVAGLYWIGNALLVDGNPYAWAWPLAVLALPSVLAVYTGLAAALYATVKNRFVLPGYFGDVFLWSGLLSFTEYLRGHLFTGFPWNLFGHAFSEQLEILQVLSLAGPYFLSLYVILTSAALSKFLTDSAAQKKAQALSFTVMLIAGFAGAYIWGSSRIARIETREKSAPALTIRLVQPSIAQSEKWRPEKIPNHYRKIMDMSAAPAPDGAGQAGGTGPVLVVWPETAMTSAYFDYARRNGDLETLFKKLPEGSLLAAGLLMIESAPDGSPQYANSLVIADSEKNFGRYDKAHLVPFGEYIPLGKWLPFDTITGFSGFKRGRSDENLKIRMQDTVQVHPLICYEVIFPISSKGLNNSQFAKILLNVTNDAWYGHSPGPHQHLSQSRMRAIEQGLPLIRVANNGISAGVSTDGSLIVKLEYNMEKSFDLRLPLLKSFSFYFFIGDKIYLLILFLLFLFICTTTRSNPDSRDTLFLYLYFWLRHF